MGDACVRIALGAEISDTVHRRVVAVIDAVRALREAGDLPGLLDVVPAYATLLLRFDPAVVDVATIESLLSALVTGGASPSGMGVPAPSDSSAGRLVEVPVCYEPAYAPDIAGVAADHGVSVADVVRGHSGAAYRVYFVGFSPGFAYMGGLPAWLATPRLAEPRTRVPVGSVGIAGDQTGVYPHATPGGWRLIGRTPTPMFDAARATGGGVEEASTLRIGDRVRFVPISAAEFEANAGAYAARGGGGA